MPNVLVFAETRGNALRKVALEATSAARALADASGGGEVHALVAGTPGVASVGASSSASMARTSSSSSSMRRSRNFDREAVAATIAARARRATYRAIVLGFSAQGRDVGPRVAAKLDAPIARRRDRHSSVAATRSSSSIRRTRTR